MSDYLKPPQVKDQGSPPQSKPVKISGSALGGGRRRTKPYDKPDGKNKTNSKKKPSGI